jgi:phosphinothricin acetyltransferase
VIRLARPEDAQAMLDIYAPVVRDTFISFELEPPTVEEMRGRVEKTLATHPWLVYEHGGRLAGYSYASRHRERHAYQWSVDVSCYVHPQFRGQGIGARLYRALLGILKRQGFQCAYAGIALPNEASVRLHESVGFRRIGIYHEVGHKLGAWRDTGWYELRIGDAPQDPAAPIALANLGPRILDEL